MVVLEPTVVDLSMTRGLTWPGARFTCRDPDTNEIVDLSGYTAFAEVRFKPGDPLILDLTPSIDDAPGGLVVLPKISKEETVNAPRGGYSWDLTFQRTSDGERFGPFAIGTFDIREIDTKGDPALPPDPS